MSPIRLGVIALAVATFAIVLINFARADDLWSQSPNRSWYNGATLTDAARKRFPFEKCCDHADVVRTKFTVNKTTKGDDWFWLNPRTTRWEQVPPDIIHYYDRAPDGQPTLFVYNGDPTCFYPPDGGI
jgi:hypothetical protein